MYRRLSLMLVIAMILAAAEAGADEIRIGFASALSGPFAATGARYRLATEVAVEDLNRTGGVLGSTVRLVVADDACGIEQAEQAAQQLADAHVRFVVGHLCSHSSLIAAGIYEAAGVPMMSVTSSHPRLTEEGRANIFRLIGRNDRQGQIAGDFLATHWRDAKIAILHDGSTYGAGLADQTRQQLHERGVAEALDAIYPPGVDDYSGLVERLQLAGIEVAYVGGYGPDAARIIQTARARGDNVQLIGGHALGMPEFWSIAGKAGTGTIFTGRRDTGLGPETDRIAAVLQSHGIDPLADNLAAYAAIQVWAQAVERAGSTDGVTVTKAMHSGRFDTALGWIAFDADGDLADADWQWQVWADGKYELLNPALAQLK